MPKRDRTFTLSKMRSHPHLSAAKCDRSSLHKKSDSEALLQADRISSSSKVRSPEQQLQQQIEAWQALSREVGRE